MAIPRFGATPSQRVGAASPTHPARDVVTVGAWRRVAVGLRDARIFDWLDRYLGG